MKIPEEVVIFGAGSIGRGFLGQIFGRSGWRVTFVDVNERFVDALNSAGGYRVSLVSPDGTVEDVDVPNVRAVHARDGSSVAAALRGARYVGTAVGAAALPAVARQLAASLPADALANYDIILAENVHDPDADFTRYLQTGADGAATDGSRADGPASESTASEGSAAEGFVPEGSAPEGTASEGSASEATAALAGVHLCAVGKMVPETDLSSGSLDLVTEAMNTLLVNGADWRNPIPEIEWLEPVEPIDAFIDRKLYVHNLIHAAMAFLSVRHCPGCRYVADLTSEESLMRVVAELVDDVSGALAAQYPSVFTRRDLLAHAEDLVYRFSNRRLGDTVRRVGRDVPRKLGSGERVVGALRLLHRHGMPVQRVLDVYEAALSYGIADGQLSAAELTAGSARDLVVRFSGADIPPGLLDALIERVERFRTTGPAGTLGM